MKTIPFARKKRQFKNLLKQIKSHPAENQQRVLKKLQRLYRDLIRLVDLNWLHAKLIAAGLLFSACAFSQTFDTWVRNPYGLSDLGSPNIVSGVYVTCPVFCDLDDDGDLDMMSGSDIGLFKFQENLGSATNPSFNPTTVQTNPFNLSATGYFYVRPTFADFDGDGDFDILAGEFYGNFLYFENTGTATTPDFTGPVVNPMNLSNIGDYVATPSLVDIDNDGDLDIFCGMYTQDVIVFYENTGTAFIGDFATPVNNAFNITPPTNSSNDVSSPAFMDVDQDGDKDLFVARTTGSWPNLTNSIDFYENTGTASNPDFALPVSLPFNLTSVPIVGGYYPYIRLSVADINANGKPDLFAGGGDGDQYVSENLSCFLNATAFYLSDTVLGTNSQTGFSYQWINCDNGNTPVFGSNDTIFQPYVSGNYAVMITDLNSSCSVSSACYYVNVPVLGIETQFQTSEFLHSNYLNHSQPLVIDLARFKEKIRINLIDSRGRDIGNHDFTGGSQEVIATDGLPAGIYFIRLIDSNGNVLGHEKFILYR